MKSSQLAHDKKCAQSDPDNVASKFATARHTDHRAGRPLHGGHLRLAHESTPREGPPRPDYERHLRSEQPPDRLPGDGTPCLNGVQGRIESSFILWNLSRYRMDSPLSTLGRQPHPAVPASMYFFFRSDCPWRSTLWLKSRPPPSRTSAPRRRFCPARSAWFAPGNSCRAAAIPLVSSGPSKKREFERSPSFMLCCSRLLCLGSALRGRAPMAVVLR